MKKMVILLVGALFLTVAVTAFAEEELGFIQRMKNKFMKKPTQATTTTKAAASPVIGKTDQKASASVPTVEEVPIKKEA
ncbi:MAG: hypothetical protein NTZ95_07640 [Candidatus Omnitrophica bacterium]|nr:hypothetical protein [Candidatus Omnitrophota bacterium]